MSSKNSNKSSTPSTSSDLGSDFDSAVLDAFDNFSLSPSSVNIGAADPLILNSTEQANIVLKTPQPAPRYYNPKRDLTPLDGDKAIPVPDVAPTRHTNWSRKKPNIRKPVTGMKRKILSKQLQQTKKINKNKQTKKKKNKKKKKTWSQQLIGGKNKRKTKKRHHKKNKRTKKQKKTKQKKK